MIFYEPDADDVKAHLASEQSNRQVIAQTAFINKITVQFPYLFGLYASTFTSNGYRRLDLAFDQIAERGYLRKSQQ